MFDPELGSSFDSISERGEVKLPKKPTHQTKEVVLPSTLAKLPENYDLNEARAETVKTRDELKASLSGFLNRVRHEYDMCIENATGKHSDITNDTKWIRATESNVLLAPLGAVAEVTPVNSKQSARDYVLDRDSAQAEVVKQWKDGKGNFVKSMQELDRQARELLMAVDQALENSERLGRAGESLAAAEELQKANILAQRASRMITQPETDLRKIRDPEFKKRVERGGEAAGQFEAPVEENRYKTLAVVTAATVGTALLAPAAGAAGVGLGVAFFMGACLGLATGSLFNIVPTVKSWLSGERSFKEAAKDFGWRTLSDLGLSASNAAWAVYPFGVGKAFGSALGFVSRILPAPVARVFGKFAVPGSAFVSAATPAVLSDIVMKRFFGQSDPNLKYNILVDGGIAAAGAQIAMIKPVFGAASRSGLFGRLMGHGAVDLGLATAQGTLKGEEFTLENIVERAKHVATSQAFSLGLGLGYVRSREALPCEILHREKMQAAKDIRSPLEKNMTREAAYEVLGLKNAKAVRAGRFNDFIEQRVQDLNAENFDSNGKMISLERNNELKNAYDALRPKRHPFDVKNLKRAVKTMVHPDGKESKLDGYADSFRKHINKVGEGLDLPAFSFSRVNLPNPLAATPEQADNVRVALKVLKIEPETLSGNWFDVRKQIIDAYQKLAVKNDTRGHFFGFRSRDNERGRALDWAYRTLIGKFDHFF